MSRDTTMRGQAAAARHYRFSQHGRIGRGLQGDHVIRPGCGVETWKPSWKGTTTTIRIYPVLCPENPDVFDPWRFTAEPDDWGDWIRTYPAVRNFGDPGVTFILNDPSDEAYDSQLNPAWILFRAIDSAVAAGQGRPSWAPLLRGGAGRGAVLSRPSQLTLVQCAILQHNSKITDSPPRGGADNDGLIVMELSSSAVGVMLELMNKRRENYTGPMDDFDNSFEEGDPVSIHAGRFINFFQQGHDPRERQEANTQRRTSTFGQSRQAPAQGGNRDEPIGFGCFMSDDFRGMGPELTAVEDMVRHKVKVWDDIIFLPTHEQQVRWISGAFPPDVVVYALEAAYGHFIPDATYAAATNRSQVQGGYDPSQAEVAPAPGRIGRRGFGGTTGSGANSSEQAPAPTDSSFSEEAHPQEVLDYSPAPTALGRRQRGTPQPPQGQTAPPPSQQPTQAPPPTRQRGFGGQAPLPPGHGGQTTVQAETAPAGGLAEPATGATQVFDAPPTSVEAQSSAAVQAAIQNSRRRIQNRGAAPVAPVQ